MNIALWITQLFLGLSFLLEAIKKIALPANLPEFSHWLYELPRAIAISIGVAELAAAAGLILPGLLKKHPHLTSWAAVGIGVNMIGAIVYHIVRAESENITLNVILLLMSAFVAWGRWKAHPHPVARSTTSAPVTR